jgi:pilus assembly protein CpaE
VTITQTTDARRDFMAWLDDDNSLDAVRQGARLAGLPDGAVQRGDVSASLAFLETNSAPRSIVVDVGSAEIIESMNRLADACEPGTRVVALGSANDVEIYRQLLDLGVTDYLVKPAAPEAIARALNRAPAADAAGPAKQRKPFTTLAVIGTRGGCGSTSTALSIAWAAAHRHGLRTLLLDLDLQFGSAAMSLDLEPSRGLREILSNPDRIDSLLVRSALTRESERLGILSAEEPLETPLDLHGEGLKALLKWVEEEHDLVVIDVSRRMDAMGRTALELSDTVCVVTDLSLAGMRDTKRILKLMAERRPDGRTVLVANRVGGVAGEVPRAEFERAGEARIDFSLPYDARAASASADEGKALAAVAEPALAAEFARVLGSLVTVENPPEQRAARSWLQRLVGA